MKKQDLIWGVIQRMTLYGAGAGVLLGLLYFWAASIVGLFIGYVGGMITGLIDGMIMAAFVNFALRPFAELSSYRYVMATISSAIAAGITFFALFALLPGHESMLSWQPITFVVFIALPVLIAGIAAWWATVRVLKWVQDQNRGA